MVIIAMPVCSFANCLPIESTDHSTFTYHKFHCWPPVQCRDREHEVRSAIANSCEKHDNTGHSKRVCLHIASSDLMPLCIVWLTMVLMWCDSWHTYQVNETSSLTSRGSLKVSLERLNVIKLLTIYSRTMDTHRTPTDSEQHTHTNKRERGYDAHYPTQHHF